MEPEHFRERLVAVDHASRIREEQDAVLHRGDEGLVPLVRGGLRSGELADPHVAHQAGDQPGDRPEDREHDPDVGQPAQKLHSAVAFRRDEVQEQVDLAGDRLDAVVEAKLVAGGSGFLQGGEGTVEGGEDLVALAFAQDVRDGRNERIHALSATLEQLRQAFVVTCDGSAADALGIGTQLAEVAGRSRRVLNAGQGERDEDRPEDGSHGSREPYPALDKPHSSLAFRRSQSDGPFQV